MRLFLLSFLVASTSFASSYPVFENGTSLPLAERPLQSLDVGSTLQRPRESGALHFAGGIYTLEGSLRSLGRRLSESEPYCFVNPSGVGRVVAAERLEERFGCSIDSIEGSEHVEKGQQESSYRTEIKLNCGADFIELVCHKPSNGQAKEMTLGEFEKILFKEFRLGKLNLETPLARTGNTGWTLESPITPEQLLKGQIQFKWNVSEKMKLGEPIVGEEKVYRQYLRNGVVTAVSKDRDAGSVLIAVRDGAEKLQVAPSASDLNGMEITGSSTGYSKTRVTKDFTLRSAYLLATGKKTLQGVETKVSAYWSEPLHSHVTYEGMWKLPGRALIENWAELGR
jgi:hypothetical protein